MNQPTRPGSSQVASGCAKSRLPNAARTATKTLAEDGEQASCGHEEEHETKVKVGGGDEGGGVESDAKHLELSVVSQAKG